MHHSQGLRYYKEINVEIAFEHNLSTFDIALPSDGTCCFGLFFKYKVINPGRYILLKF